VRQSFERFIGKPTTVGAWPAIAKEPLVDSLWPL
jgi:hypothetical protein